MLEPETETTAETETPATTAKRRHQAIDREPSHCPRCGAPIPAGAGSSCPACVLTRAMAEPGDETLEREAAWTLDRYPSLRGVPDPARRRVASLPQSFGHYRLVRLLGQGGMGQVYEAEHRVSGRRVALKRLGSQLDSSEMRQRFLREGRLAASVSHPNSLYVFGSEEIDGEPVITMEVAASGTLQDELARRGPLPVREAVDAMLDVVSGLEAAQAVGVLHRDVKPSNCFRTPEGRVKVGDYGLSISILGRDPGRQDSFASAPGLILGTPAYASPEQLRGDELDVRADIYSVGATLYSLLTGRAPFEGQNAVQIVANAVRQEAKRPSEQRPEVPPGLERLVLRCLSKEPGARFASYRSLRDALLPFSSREAEPAPMKVRAVAGWIDFLIAFLTPYVALVLMVGSAEFHYGWLLERTFASARPYLAFLGSGLLYFTVAEGLGGGFGKRQKGLEVVRGDGRRPGFGRALIRIATPIAVIESVRLPLLLLWIDARSFEQLTPADHLVYLVATTLCPCVAVIFHLSARLENGFATLWDRLSGTRVVFTPVGIRRPELEPAEGYSSAGPSSSIGEADSRPGREPGELAPFRIEGELIPDRWLLATDPVLRRDVWLVHEEYFSPSPGRRALARPGRARWLQRVEASDGVWHAYEASPGRSLGDLVAGGRRLAWADLRHWLHDLASELWAAEADGTLPQRASLDQVWLTPGGRAMLLDLPWPAEAGFGEARSSEPRSSEAIEIADLAGQQRFLSALADCARSTSLPMHARPVLENLADGRFEKLSFLAGTLRGLLDRPATLPRWVRAGALFMLPTYNWIMVRVGTHESAEQLGLLIGHRFGDLAFFITLVILACAAATQLSLLPFRTTAGHALFRLALIDKSGGMASRKRLLARWAIAWLPLIGALLALAWSAGSLAGPLPQIVTALWLAAALWTALDPHRGPHDRLAGTWLARR
ncbi:MAG: protein kinase [Holophagales bacterium]|nr:protein kinase [Holophagales bacterium]